MVQFVGKYKYEKHENFEEYMKAIGIGLVARKLMLATSPTLDIIDEGNNKYTLKTQGVKNTEVTFTLGEEYDDEFPNGDKVKSTTVITDDKMITSSKGKKGVTEITREFNADTLVVHVKDGASGVEAKRYYKRI